MHMGRVVLCIWDLIPIRSSCSIHSISAITPFSVFVPSLTSLPSLYPFHFMCHALLPHPVANERSKSHISIYHMSRRCVLVPAAMSLHRLGQCLMLASCDAPPRSIMHPTSPCYGANVYKRKWKLPSARCWTCNRIVTNGCKHSRRKAYVHHKFCFLSSFSFRHRFLSI